MNDKINSVDIMTARHSLSHVLAAAVKKVCPECKLGIGPAIDEGFYYDFLLPEGFTFMSKVPAMPHFTAQNSMCRCATP